MCYAVIQLSQKILIILLPGLDGTGILSQRLKQQLPDAQLIVYPCDQIQTTDELVALIRANAKDCSRVLMVGESYSGAIALRYAAKYPQQVSGVVMIAGFIAPPWPTWMAKLVGAWMFRIRPPKWFVRMMFTGFWSQASDVRIVIEAVRTVSPTVLVDRLRKALSIDHRTAVASVIVPILYIAGKSDRLVGRRSADRVRKLLPQTRVVRIAGPHVLSHSTPEAVASHIMAFVSQLPEVTSMTQT